MVDSVFYWVTMLNFPEWSDLGSLSPETRNSWETEMAIRAKYRSYYDGTIFSENVPLEAGATEDAPELYPVGVNLVKMLCLSQADSEYGEWEDDIIIFQPRQEDESDSPEVKACALANKIMRASDAPTMLWQTSLDRNVYGGSAIYIHVDLTSPAYIKWKHIPLGNFFPVWDPENPDELLETYIVTQMTKEQARAKYGYDRSTTEPYVTRVDHWTRGSYIAKLDGNRLDAYSGQNPWGFLPFEYIPRQRTTDWWGDALTADLIRVQDELNMRIADLGEAINYNSHPIKWGYNMPKTFNAKNFPIGPGEFWDLGRTIGSAPEPKVGVLESQNPIPEGVFQHINFLYDWGRTSVFAPPIAFGEDRGGGQRSGITLEIRMLPLIKATRRARAYGAAGISRAMVKSGKILKQKKLGDAYAVPRIISGDIVPTYAPILPRDQAKIVDEVIKRMSSTPPSISLETAVIKLGDRANEVNRIKTQLDDDDLYKRSIGGFGAPPGADGATGADPTEDSSEDE